MLGFEVESDQGLQNPHIGTSLNEAPEVSAVRARIIETVAGEVLFQPCFAYDDIDPSTRVSIHSKNDIIQTSFLIHLLSL